MTPTPLSFSFRQRRAVLISGGLDSYHNYPRFLNDLKIFYDCLVNEYGYAHADIQVLYANGGTHDLAGQQIATQYCNHKNVIGALKKAVAGLSANDLFIIMTTNHGKATSPHEMKLWGVGEKLTASDLGAELAAISDAHLLGVFGECYGGNMFLNVQSALTKATQAKTVLVASSTSASWSLPPDDAYDAFLYYFTSALARKTPSNYPVDADGKSGTAADGHVDIREAFEHAKSMDKTSDKPDLLDATPPIARRLTLQGMLP
jgi:hypothetical protein